MWDKETGFDEEPLTVTVGCCQKAGIIKAGGLFIRYPYTLVWPLDTLVRTPYKTETLLKETTNIRLECYRSVHVCATEAHCLRPCLRSFQQGSWF